MQWLQFQTWSGKPRFKYLLCHGIPLDNLEPVTHFQLSKSKPSVLLLCKGVGQGPKGIRDCMVDRRNLLLGYQGDLSCQGQNLLKRSNCSILRKFRNLCREYISSHVGMNSGKHDGNGVVLLGNGILFVTLSIRRSGRLSTFRLCRRMKNHRIWNRMGKQKGHCCLVHLVKGIMPSRWRTDRSRVFPSFLKIFSMNREHWKECCRW